MALAVELKPLKERWELLKSRTKLPFNWELFARQGQAEWQVENCRRRFERKAMRTIAILVRGDELHATYTRDVSQQGIGFFTPISLLRDERVWLELPGNRLIPLRVIRSRKMGEECYASAGQYVASEAAAGTEN
jgi:hypothetical protein